MRTSPIVIAALLNIASASLTQAQQDRQAAIASKIQDVVDDIEAMGSDISSEGETYHADLDVANQDLQSDMIARDAEYQAVEDAYETAWDSLAGNLTHSEGADGWNKIYIRNNATVASQFEDAYIADLTAGNNTNNDINDWVSQVDTAFANHLSRWDANITPQARNVTAQIEDIVRSIEHPDTINATTALTTISISAADEQNISAQIDSLDADWNQFATEKDLDGQMNTWWVANDGDAKVNSTMTAVENQMNNLNTDNDIEGWSTTNNVEARIQNITDAIDSGYTVTNTAQINMAGLNPTKVFSHDEQIIWACFSLMSLVAVYAVAEQCSMNKQAKKADHFEIETDVEAPRTKKEIKKTLARVLSKNQAKATLIQ